MTAKIPVSLLPDGPVVDSAFIVAGMHRSGTSALTRTLSLLGFDLPRTLIEPASDNPTGYWESAVIASLNDEILAELNSSWNDIVIFLARYRASHSQRSLIKRMCKALEAEFTRQENIVIKDPRIGLLLRPWINALNEQGYAPKVLIPLRNPLEVAASLRQRNGFSTGRSTLLWLVYFLLAEKDSRGSKRLFVQYTDLLEDWRGVMSRVERVFNMRFTRWTTAAELQIDAFLSSTSRHQVCAADALAARSDVVDWVKRAYSWAQSAVSETTEPDPAPLDAISAELNAALQTFAPIIVELGDPRLALRNSTSNPQAEMVNRDKAISERDEAARTMTSKVQALEAVVAELDGALADRDRGIRERDEAARAMTAKVEALEIVVAELDAALADRDRAIIERDESTRAMTAKIQALSRLATAKL